MAEKTFSNAMYIDIPKENYFTASDNPEKLGFIQRGGLYRNGKGFTGYAPIISEGKFSGSPRLYINGIPAEGLINDKFYRSGEELTPKQIQNLPVQTIAGVAGELAALGLRTPTGRGGVEGEEAFVRDAAAETKFYVDFRKVMAKAATQAKPVPANAATTGGFGGAGGIAGYVKGSKEYYDYWANASDEEIFRLTGGVNKEGRPASAFGINDLLPPGESKYVGAEYTVTKQGGGIPMTTMFGTDATGTTRATGTTGATGATGAITQADVDASVTKALAAQQLKFDALIAQQKAEADAVKLAGKIKAKDRLVNMLASFDLGDLAGFVDRRIMQDASEEQVMLELYDQPEYQKRFPGMKALREKGKTITEAEYIRDEKAFIQTARFFDLPKGFYDSADDFGKLIGNLVSPKEYQDRLQVGQDLSRSLNPAVKNELINLYGVGEGDITAWVLDSERAAPLIQKQAKAAQFVGIARSAGFGLGGITAQQAENIAGTESYAKLSEAELSKALGAAGQLRSTQERLARLEGTAYSEQEALSAVIEGSSEALLASQQRAQREAARFSTRGGVMGSSLRSTTTI